MSMDCNKPPQTKHKLNSLFSLPSTATVATVKATSSTATYKRTNRRNGRSLAGVLFLVLLDLWGAVPIIILITTTGAPTTVSAVSIAAVSIASNSYENGKANGGSGNFDTTHQQLNYKPAQAGQPHKLSFISGNDASGKVGSVGVLNLSFGEIQFASKRHHESKQNMMAEKSIKKDGIIVKRNVGDTRITSNQDVTTLALAVDNSSSVAISNINSQFNNVYVTIGTSSTNRFETGNGNRYTPFPDDFEDF